MSYDWDDCCVNTAGVEITVAQLGGLVTVSSVCYVASYDVHDLDE